MKTLLIVLLSIVLVQAAELIPITTDTVKITLKSKKDPTAECTMKFWNASTVVMSGGFGLGVITKYSVNPNKPFWSWYGRTSQNKCIVGTPYQIKANNPHIQFNPDTTMQATGEDSVLNVKLYITTLAYSTPTSCGFNYAETLIFSFDYGNIYDSIMKSSAIESKPLSSKQLSTDGVVYIYDINGKLVDKVEKIAGWNPRRSGVYLGRYRSGLSVKIIRI